MDNETFALRKKGVVTFYMDLEAWHMFGKACEGRQSTRGQQLIAFIDAKMAEWNEAPVTQEREE